MSKARIAKVIPQTINAREAVKFAFVSFAQVYPKVSDDLRLEEVFLDDKEENWLTTVSFPNPDYHAEKADDSPYSRALQMIGREGAARRLAKRIKLRASDGKFIGILNV